MRVVENLNQALRGLLDEDPSLFLLGEDIVDPYGGAFKATRGASTRHPDRVLATPISEGGITGIAAGLALAGDRAIVEIMFGDFLALCFDQIVNFASKSVTMYGRRVPMRLVVRCPVGGNRGYGPTHSQSPQKHFVGVPNLALFEMTPFHDNTATFSRMLDRGEPCIHFEDKILYTQRMYRGGRVDGLLRYDFVGADGGTARVRVEDPDEAEQVVIVPGGLANPVLAAVRSLFLAEERSCLVYVPSQLYPFDLDPLLPSLRRAGRVVIVEEGTAGGTWGADVAQLIHQKLWRDLRRPVRLVHSAPSVVPTAPHLERGVLVQESTIYQALRETEDA
ncbi:transketolase C-terminal domain-containing protein [Micromonospora sp. NPDC126480]|uniref:alpha-ketoacid dehydrogenase subunit beta n=1 Tax=Micromonospora sp. NPDC126480 TaxID=3155312 RepID=UPI0033244D24